jgi:hypothetical protein
MHIGKVANEFLYILRDFLEFMVVFYEKCDNPQDCTMLRLSSAAV